MIVHFDKETFFVFAALVFILVTFSVVILCQNKRNYRRLIPNSFYLLLGISKLKRRSLENIIGSLDREFGKKDLWIYSNYVQKELQNLAEEKYIYIEKLPGIYHVDVYYKITSKGEKMLPKIYGNQERVLSLAKVYPFQRK